MKFTTSKDGSTAVPEFMNRRLDEPRKIKVICIGAGVTGIMAAAIIPRRLKNVELQIYDKNEEIGGTWFENTYPGIACDVPSHAYQASFAPNPRWSRFYSGGKEIFEYWKGVADLYGCRQYIKLGAMVTDCYWKEDEGLWEVHLKTSGGEFVDKAEILIGAHGILNEARWPQIKGLFNYRGKLLHPSRWDHTLDLSDKTVAVIGNGSSAIQIIPNIASRVKKLDSYIRSPTWIATTFAAEELEERGETGGNFNYLEEEIDKFSEDSECYQEYLRKLHTRTNSAHMVTFRGSELATGAEKITARLMKTRSVKDPTIAEMLMPSFAIGCKRPTPGTGYIETLCEDHVTMISTPIKEFDETGIILNDGTHTSYDVIITASGYDTSFKRQWNLFGKDGVNLQDLWSDVPESYMGIAAPSMPNYFQPMGPNGIVVSAPFTVVIETLFNYMLVAIEKIQSERIKSMIPKQSAIDHFSQFCQQYFPTTVFTDQCSTWFKGAANHPERVTACWPGSYLHFRTILSRPRWEDYNYEYLDENPYFYLGNGLLESDVLRQGDFAPYITKSDFPELLQIYKKSKKAQGTANGTELKDRQHHSNTKYVKMNDPKNLDRHQVDGHSQPLTGVTI